MSENHDYDAIIIGAGISGLVCGCYLAKAGLKTLIVEKSAIPGGYCVSFKRKGYQFDACVHFLSSFRKNSKFYKILNEINLFKEVEIIRHNPSDIIITPELKINIFNKPSDTIKEFQNNFPHQRIEIKRFFDYILKTSTLSLACNRTKTLEQFLDSFFSDKLLKTILSTIILGLAGSPSYNISAMVACLIYREFILFDGGYYPAKGMQEFANGLARSFVNYGGQIIYSNEVTRIKILNNKASGVVLDSGSSFSCKYVVSASDAVRTFKTLIGEGNISSEFSKRIDSFVPSFSSFLVYLAMDDAFTSKENLRSNLWVINSTDEKEICSELMKCRNIHLAITSSSMKACTEHNRTQFKNTLCLTTTSPFLDSKYWSNLDNRIELETRLIDLASKVIPGLKEHINFKFNATPLTLYNWTYNFKGAAYGWEGTPIQFENPEIPQATEIGNLFIAGHWSKMGSGVTSVANSGYDTANLILYKEKKI